MAISGRSVRVSIHRAALESVFDECDRFDRDETGGRLIGTYETGRRGGLSVTVSGVIEPGPDATRSATSFFQDGDYQESVFRRLEAEHPEIEHLGNWHTHHVNGYPTLSGGDRETYHRIVNHENHNTDFFYALLVTARNADARRKDRYSVKHFILIRGQDSVYEIPASRVRIVDRPVIWPRPGTEHETVLVTAKAMPGPADERAKDSEFFKELFPGLRPFLSKSSGRVYWRGRIVLCDETSPEIIAAELEEDGRPVYRIAVKEQPDASPENAGALPDRRFRSAREAVVLLEREMNRYLFRTRIAEASRITQTPEGE